MQRLDGETLGLLALGFFSYQTLELCCDADGFIRLNNPGGRDEKLLSFRHPSVSHFPAMPACGICCNMPIDRARQYRSDEKKTNQVSLKMCDSDLDLLRRASQALGVSLCGTVTVLSTKAARELLRESTQRPLAARLSVAG